MALFTHGINPISSKDRILMTHKPTFNQFNKVNLITTPTPIEPLSHLGKEWKTPKLFVKREDQTASIYGGNKVRNLEFLLGDAIQKKSEKILALAPLGSNFIAALAAQSSRVGLPVEVMHFVPESNKQIEMHAQFSRMCQARLTHHSNYYLGSLALASLHFLTKKTFGSGVYPMPIGGSNALGALGHVQAALELSEQIKMGEITEPDYLFVGTGTCGTMAGLQVGLDLANIKTKLIGIRCVDKLFCHRHKISGFANDTARLLGATHNTYSAKDFLLLDLPQLNYGKTLPEAVYYMAQFKALEAIQLDHTYTSKVVYQMKHFIDEFKLHSKTILFWNTFSPKAMTMETRHSNEHLPSWKPSLGTYQGK